VKISNDPNFLKEENKIEKNPVTEKKVEPVKVFTNCEVCNKMLKIDEYRYFTSVKCLH
jgi:hypothetical protein